MRKPLKIVLIVAGALVALVVVAAIVLPLVVDPNKYKGRIAQEVQKATGREFAILGDIDLSVFPWLGLDIGRMRLANAQGFGGEPMAEVLGAQVRVKLLPLLSRRVEMGKVVIQDPVIRLAKDKQGRTNWQDIQEHMERQAAEQPPEKPAEPGEPGKSPLESIELAGLEVENGLLVWNDMQADARYEVRELNVEVGELSMQGQPRPFPVSASCAFTASKPQAGGILELSSTVTLNMDQKTARTERTTLKLNIDKLVQQSEGTIQTVAGTLAVTANALTDWGQGVADVQGLKLTSDMRVGTEQSVQGGRKTQSVTARSTLGADAVVRWVESAARVNGLALRTDYAVNMTDASQPGGGKQSVNGRLDLAGDADVNWVKGLANLAGLKLDTSYKLTMPGEKQGQEQSVNGRLVLATDADVNWINSFAKIKGVRVDTDFRLNTLDQNGAQSISGNAALAADTVVNWAKSLAEIDALKLDATFTMDRPGAAIAAAQGSGQAAKQSETISGKANLSAAARIDWAEGLAQLRKLALAATASGASLPAGKAVLGFDAEAVGVNWIKGNLDLPRFEAKAYDVNVTGSAQGRNLLDKAAIQGTLNVAEFNPGELVRIMTGEPLKTSDPKALRQASASLAYSATQDSLAVSKLEARLDETVLTGNATVKGFERPDVAFTLAANRLNVDRYMPPETKAGKPAPAPAPAPGEKKPAEPGMLQRMTVNGAVTVGQFQAMNVKASDIRMTVRGKDGVFRVDPLTATMYKGSVKAVGGATLREQISDPSLALDIANLQIGPLLQDYLGKLGWIGGSTTAKLDFSGQGTLDTIVKTLNGSGDVTIRHGVLRGFTLVPGAVSQLLGSATSGSLNKVTEFDQLGASFLIKQGDLNFKRLFMATPQSKVESSGGSASLDSKEVRLPLNMVSDKFPKIKGLPVNTMPLALTGSYTDLSSLKLAVDEQAFQKILQQQATGAAQKELQKQLGGKLPGGLGDVLGGGQKQPAPGGQPKDSGAAEKPASPEGQDLGKALEEGLGGLFGGGKK